MNIELKDAANFKIRNSLFNILHSMLAQKKWNIE